MDNKEYMYVCVSCKQPFSCPQENANYKCNDCGQTLIPLFTTEQEWNEMNQEARTKVLKEKLTKYKEEYIASKNKAGVRLPRIIAGFLAILICLFGVKYLLGCYDVAIAYGAYEQIFPFGWITLTKTNTKVPSSGYDGGSGSVERTQDEQKNKEYFSIGEEVSFVNQDGGEITLTVNECEEKLYDRNGWGSVFAVHYTIENNGSTDYYASQYNFEFYGDDYKLDLIFPEGQDGGAGKVSPGRIVSGTVYTDEIPDDYNSFEMEIYNLVLKIK